MYMESTTYMESVRSMPIFENSVPGTPMEKGMAYMVRPFMESLKRGRIFCVHFVLLHPVVGGACVSLISSADHCSLSSLATSFGWVL